MSRQVSVIAAIIAIVAMLSALRNAAQVSPDLLATWMAGLNFARGAFDQIYPAAGSVFYMHPPDSWITELRAAGHREAIYPFIYPPLWAWMGAQLTKVAEYYQIVAIANFVNPALLGLMLWLAARMSRIVMSPVIYVCTGLLMFSMTAMAIVAIEQNQPQIVVAFLTVLAVERSVNGAPRTAGFALALAASIKLYPVLFVLFWLIRGERRPVIAFTVAGLGLGFLSVAVAGWPLHVAFLEQMRIISGTALLTFFTYNIDAVVAKVFFRDAMTFVEDLDLGSATGWTVLAKPTLWKILDALALLAALGGLTVLARRTRDPLFWPLAFTAIALVSPLSWGYHYLAALAFLPSLLDRIGIAAGILTALVILFPSSPIYIVADLPTLKFTDWSTLLGTLAMFGYAALLLALILRPERETQRPLRSDPAPL